MQILQTNCCRFNTRLAQGKQTAQQSPENVILTMFFLPFLSREPLGGLAGGGAAFAGCSLPRVQLLPPPNAFCPNERVGARLLWQHGPPLHHTGCLTLAHRRIHIPSLIEESSTNATKQEMRESEHNKSSASVPVFLCASHLIKSKQTGRDAPGSSCTPTLNGSTHAQ